VPAKNHLERKHSMMPVSMAFGTVVKKTVLVQLDELRLGQGQLEFRDYILISHGSAQYIIFVSVPTSTMAIMMGMAAAMMASRLV